MSKNALLVIDIQNDYFNGGKYPLSEMDAVAANAARLIADARRKNTCIIHVQHIFPSQEAPFFTPGSDGSRIHSSVAPQDGETVIIKNNPNPFLDTDLKPVLDAAGIETITVIGAMSHMCIDATVRAASDFGYAVTVVEDACATRDLEHDGKTVPAAMVQTAMMSALGFAYAAITTTDQYLTTKAG